MALFAIGDVQGCLGPLKSLLSRIRFNSSQDTLWFTGDLVNRGPDSAAVLRLVMGLPRAVTVLGNHDLHLLAVASGSDRFKSRDTFDDVLAAPDRDALLGWLRKQPLLHHDARAGFTLVHAGIPPDWDLKTAILLAREAEAVIAASAENDFFDHMYGNQPDRWHDGLEANDRLRFIVNFFTRARYVDRDSRMDLSEKGPVGSQPVGLIPWFNAADRRTKNARIVFGHWSTLGVMVRPDIVALDSGCLWGRELTAARLDLEVVELMSVPCERSMPFVPTI